MKKIKVGIIGLGSMAQTLHLPVLTRFKEVEITGICDIDRLRLKVISKKFSINDAFTNLNDFLSAASYDVIFILTPTQSHKELISKCSQFCKNIFIEKPLSKSLKEAREISSFISQTSLNLFIGMNFRFRPDSMLLKSMIDKKDLGSPHLIRVGYFKSRSNYLNSSDEYGALLDPGISILDLGLWLLDYPEIYSVTAKTLSLSNTKHEDMVSAFIKTKNNKILSIDISRALEYEKDIFYCNVFTNSGYAFLNPLRISKNLKDNNEISVLHNLKNSNQFLKSYENEIRYFINSISNLKYKNDFSAEAIQRMKVIEAIYLSSKSNKEIKI